MSIVVDYVNNNSNLIGKYMHIWNCECGSRNNLIGHKCNAPLCNKTENDYQSYYIIFANEATKAISKKHALEAIRVARKEERFIMLDTGLLGEKVLQDFLKQAKHPDDHVKEKENVDQK